MVEINAASTFVVDLSGNIVAQNRGEAEGIVLAKITLDDCIVKGPIGHRRPGIYGEILIKH